MGIRFDRYASTAGLPTLAPVALIVAAGLKVPTMPEPQRPFLQIPLPMPGTVDLSVREHDDAPAAPTRGVNVFDMV